MLTHDLASQTYRTHTPEELQRAQGLTDEVIETILNEIHGTPVDDCSIEENDNDFDNANGDFEGDYRDRMIDGGFGDSDEAGFFETEGVLHEVQGHDIEIDSDDADDIITHSDSDSDDDGPEHDTVEPHSSADDAVLYSDSNDSESDFGHDSETEEIQGICIFCTFLCYYLYSHIICCRRTISAIYKRSTVEFTGHGRW